MSHTMNKTDGEGIRIILLYNLQDEILSCTIIIYSHYWKLSNISKNTTLGLYQNFYLTDLGRVIKIPFGVII